MCNTKRGGANLPAMVLVVLFSLLIVYAVFYPTVSRKIMEIKEKTFFEKNFLVKDIATLINTLYSSPGDIMVNYDKDTHWFSYEFKEDEVAIFDKTPTFKTTYPIINNSFLDFYPITLNAKFHTEERSKKNLKEKVRLTFAKINDDIIIDQDLKRDINEIKCKNIEPLGQDKIILIDAGHGGYDEGIVANNVKEKDITGSIGFSLYQSLGIRHFFTRDNIKGSVKEQIRKVEYRNKEKIIVEVDKNNIEIIISIHIGNYKDNSNNVKAYYSIESGEDIQIKSKKLACEILNELVRKEELEITGISIIGIYPEDYEGAEILVKDKIAILLEIGNLRNERSVNILTQPGNIQVIINSMIRGLENAQ